MTNTKTFFFRATAKVMVVALLLTTCSTAVQAAGAKLRSATVAAYLQGTWNPYPETATVEPLSGYDVGGPTSPYASTWHADSVAARDDAMAKLNDPTWIRPEVEAVQGTSSTPNDPGDNSVWSADPTPSSAGNHVAGPFGSGPGSGGGGAVDGTGDALGMALAWQDSFPAGGTLLSPGVVNSYNGNRLATVPIVSWTAKGGLGIDLTLYHNSSGSAGWMWGRGWRSSYDIDVVQGPSTDNPRRATVVFGDGSTIPFVATSMETTGGYGTRLYSPPVGFYDALTRYGSAANPSGWHLRRRDGSSLEFNKYGRLAAIKDARGNTITVGRSAPNEPMTSVTDSAGRGLVFTISGVNGSIYPGYSKVTDSAGREWNFKIEVPNASGGTSMNVVGDLVFLALPKVNGPNAIEAATKLEWTYNQFGRPQILTEKDPMGKSWVYTYDAVTGRLKTAKDPLLKTTTYATGAFATMTTPRTAIWTHTYQGETIAAVKDPAGYSESYHYDARRNKDAITDRRGKVWRSTWDPYGNMISSQTPEQYSLSKSDAFVYNAANVLTSTTSARNGTTTITPESNEPKTVVDADGKTVFDATYDTAGQPLTAVTSGVSAGSVFDNYGRLTSATTADGTATVTYTGLWSGVNLALLGMPTSMTVPGRGTRELAYDGRGRVTRFNRYAPGETGLLLDALGRATRVETQDGYTYVVYDELSRVKKVTNPRGDVEEYTYDDDGNLTDILRGNGAAVHYSVTLRGDIEAEWDLNAPFPSGSGYVTMYAYDGEGNVLRTSAGAGTVVNTYDADGSLKTVTHPDSFVETYLYDADGNRTSMADRSGTTTWTYSLAGRPLTMVSPAGTVTYGYDTQGNPNDVAHTVNGATAHITTTREYPSGRVIRYGDDYTNQIATFAYDAYGRMTGRTMPAGFHTQYSYDTWGRLNSLTHKSSGGTTIRGETYTYDGTRVVDRYVNGIQTHYAYDAAGQMQSEQKYGTGAYTISYTYDRNGNRKTRTWNGVTDTYSYTGDRLDSISRSTGATKTYTYDAAGRPSIIYGFDGVGRNLTWNDEDRLIASTALPGAQLYNGDGARVKRDGVHIRRAGSSVASPVISDSPMRKILPGLAEQEVPFFTRVPMRDHLGSATGMTHAQGTSVLGTQETEAFGVPTVRTGEQSVYGWKGSWGYTDEGGGLELVGHRWYDADAGRFLTRDPARQGRNWWGYCESDPVNGLDPEGLDVRNLTSGERTVFLRGVARLWDEGYRDEAKHLRQLLKDGKIKVQTGRDKKMWNGNDSDGFTVGTTIRFSDHIFKRPSSGDNAWFQSVLLHELVHVGQNQGLFSVPFASSLMRLAGMAVLPAVGPASLRLDTLERDAYAKERRYLNQRRKDRSYRREWDIIDTLLESNAGG